MPMDDDRRRGLDTGYSWLVLVATFGGFFVCGGLLHTTGIVNTAFLDRYNENIAKTSWACSLFIMLTSFASPLGTMIIDRTSCRVTMIICGLLMAAGCMMAAFSPNIVMCVVVFGGIAGVGAGIGYNVIFVVLGFNFKRRLNIAQGIAQSGVGFGIFVLSPIMEAIKLSYGYTGFCILVAGLCLQLVVMGTMMRPSILEREVQLRRRNKANKDGNTVFSGIKETIKSYIQMAGNKSILCLSVNMFLFCGGIYSVFMYWPSLCLANGLSAMQSSLVLSITGITSIPGRIITGALASLPAVEESVIHVGSLVVAALAIILFQIYSASFVGNIVTAVIVGLTFASCFVVISTINIKCVGVQHASASIGLEFFVGGIGSIVIPVLSGYLVNGGWQFKHVFAFSGACIGLASLFALAPRVFRNDVIDDISHPQDQEIVIMNDKKNLGTNNQRDDDKDIKTSSRLL